MAGGEYISGTRHLTSAARDLRPTFIYELGHLRRLDYVSLGLMNLVSGCCDSTRCVARAPVSAPPLTRPIFLHVARLAPRHEPLGTVLAMSRPQLEQRMHAFLSPSTNRHQIGGKRS